MVGVWAGLWEVKITYFPIFGGDLVMSVLKLVLKGFENASKMQFSSLTLGVWGPRAPLGGRGIE